MNLRFLATFAAAVAVTAAFILWATAQVEAPSGKAGTGFEQERGAETIARILGPEVPHVAGSPENVAIKERIIAELTGAGYAAEVQTAVQCAPPQARPGCTYVENIIAVHKGTTPGKTVLATAHYDSVPAGPGVGDDLAGTAIMLELAKAMAKRKTRNDIVFLISDGEEIGLRGALAFATRHPLFKQVGIVVNVEARGASGPSMMFETGKGSAGLIDLYARTVPRPRANSLTYEVYQLLPNDTDFSVYREAANLSGFNFAFSNSASLYHSRNDNLANLDRNTLQHHGDNAFAIVTALADTDLATLNAGADASYFDLHGLTMVVWPAALNVPIAALSLLAIIGLIAAHRSAFTFVTVGWSALALIAIVALLFATGWLLSFPLGIWPGVHPIDHPAPWPARIALGASGIAVALFVSLFATRAGMRALLLLGFLLLAALSLAVAATVTGAAYPLMWPVATVAVVGWIETRALRRNTLILTAASAFVATSFFFLTFLVFLELVLGFDLNQFKILVWFPIVFALTALFVANFSRWEACLALAATCIVVAAAALVASQTPAYAPNHPRGQNITYYDDGIGAPRWLVGFVGAPDKAYLKANGFPATAAPIAKGTPFESEALAKPATDQKLAAPELVATQVVQQDKLRVLHVTLKGARGGLRMALAFDGASGVQAIRVAGQDLVGTQRLSQKGSIVAGLTGFALREVPLEIVYDPAKRPLLFVSERSNLPDAAEARTLTESRAADAAPVHNGDGAVVIRSYDLEELAPP
jgi:hypothetical protein